MYLAREKKEATATIGPVTMDRFTVDLSIVGGHEFNSRFKESDRDHHIRQQLNQSGTCSLEDVVNTSSAYTIISGVAGVGKSHFASEIGYKWARGEVLREVSFLFIIKCRECIGLTCSTLQEFLEALFPNVFNNLSSKYLSSNSDKCYFVFDGFDEYSGLDNIMEIHQLKKTQTDFPAIDHAVYDIISPTNGIFHNSRMILTGRPESCNKLNRLYYNTKTKHTNCVILGFNGRVVQQYINTFYGNNDHSAKIRVQNKLNESESLTLMSRLPLYLNIICSLYHEYSDIDLGDSPLELYTWEMAFLLQKHICKDNNISELPTINIFNESLSDMIIKPLSQTVFQMHVEQKFIFTEREIPKALRTFNFDSSGLIMKIQTSMGNKYQFFHLTMSEFLTATYLLYDKSIALVDKILKGGWHVILLFLCGLEGGLVENSASPQVIQNFVKSLNVNKPQRFLISDILQRFLASSQQDKLLRLFMECYFAFQNQLSKTDRSTNITEVFINDWWSQSDYNNFIHFIRNEPGISIDKLTIKNIPTSDNTLQQFVHCVGCCRELEIELNNDDILRYFAFQQLLSSSNRSVNITSDINNDKWSESDYNIFIKYIQNERNISINKLIITNIPTSDNTMQEFVHRVGCCKQLRWIELNATDMESFFTQFNKCYTKDDRDDHLSHSSYTTPIIDVVEVDEYKYQKNLNSLCLHDIRSVWINVSNFISNLDSSVSLIRTMNKQLNENNKTLELLRIRPSYSRNFIRGKCDQINYFSIVIPDHIKTDEIIHHIKELQNEGFEITQVRWEDHDYYDIDEFMEIEEDNIEEDNAHHCHSIKEYIPSDLSANNDQVGSIGESDALPQRLPVTADSMFSVVIDDDDELDVYRHPTLGRRCRRNCRCCKHCCCCEKCVLL